MHYITPSSMYLQYSLVVVLFFKQLLPVYCNVVTACVYSEVNNPWLHVPKAAILHSHATASLATVQYM